MIGKKTDTMLVEILDDGSLKVSIDPVSAPNHGNAEKMLLEMIKSLGGPVVTTHKHGKGGVHSHAHNHKHLHQ